MDIRKLQSAIVDGLEDVKAQDIVVFNTEHLSPLFERVIIATGSSNRQTKALASSVRQAVKGAGFQVMRSEGEDNGEWIIVDCAAAVVHIMQPAIRQYYQLEEIWGDKPVAIKTKAKAGLVKASEPDADEGKAVKPKKAAGKTTAAKKAATTAPGRKVAAKKAPAAKKAAVKAAPVAAKKAPAVKKVAAKKVAAKKAPSTVKKVVVNAPEARKAPARKVAVKKVAAKKVAVKKVAAKKAAPKKTAR
ncbi:MAG TPA: ribosome silencing factor [Aquabacterium sp.]|uniref:ribosome silencing factor n=1 Tax=Aquabacterium sp. TaxID=1872578 RepID=UPI002E350640|nr:ribosome silencing factor [Aquabacterium sp.]HEX5356151.1 ribosome silencing factor [Aquabacterium sp.]